MLTPSLTRVARIGAQAKSTLRASLLMFTVLLLCGVLAGGAIQGAAGQFGKSTEDREGDTSPFLSRAGYLRVTVDPWADVLIDGEAVVTTPTALRIPLSAGKHYVKLVNPFFQEESHEVVIHSGKTVQLETKLKPKLAATIAPSGSRR